MIARLSVLAPVEWLIPSGERLATIEEESKYGPVKILPPVQAKTDMTGQALDRSIPLMSLTDNLFPAESPTESADVLLNNQPTVRANLLRLELHRKEFERSLASGKEDTFLNPLVLEMFELVNGFLRRLRSVGQLPRQSEVSPTSSIWRIDYLQDDGSAVAKDPQKFRTQFGASIRFQAQGLTERTWEGVRSLPSDYSPPRWDTLLLDANLILGQVGPPLVLAATAVETIAAAVMDQLANATGVNPELWRWLNDRSFLKNPTLEEQCGPLLKAFSGRSLKEDSVLWEGFQNLRTARNTFVHEGVAKVGGIPLNFEQCLILVRKATDVVAYLEEFLPVEERRPLLKREITWRFGHMLRAPGTDQGET